MKAMRGLPQDVSFSAGSARTGCRTTDVTAAAALAMTRKPCEDDFSDAGDHPGQQALREQLSHWLRHVSGGREPVGRAGQAPGKRASPVGMPLLGRPNGQ